MSLPKQAALLLLVATLYTLSVDAARTNPSSFTGLISSSSSTSITTQKSTTTPWRLPSWMDMLQKKGKPTQCDEPDYRKQLLSYIKEMPFVGLFGDVRGTTKFEASGMTVANDWLWVVFDNLHALGRVDEQFEFRDPRNALVGQLGDDSQFEGLTYSEQTGHFFAVEEVYDDADHGLHPYVHEIRVNDDGQSYTTISLCPIHFVLTHENKGFEGLHIHEHQGHQIMMGLCEGNYCVGGAQGREPGNGRIVVSEFNGKSGDECGWDVIKTVEIPSTASFTDYSGMAFRGNKAAIVSQEDSAMWIGTFDFEALEFTSEGQVFYFPRDHHCNMIYCNVEGIQWLDDVRFVVASDKAKKTQPLRCVEKGERLSIFALPYEYQEEPAAAASSAGIAGSDS